QGVAGAFDLSAEFLHALSNSARQHGALLIADEVQSGMGRCGDYFAIQAHDIEPDLLTSAKSLGGGVPCAAVLSRSDIAARFGPGDLGTTFGGGPLAAAAINAVIDAIEDEGLLANVREREAQIRDRCLTGPITRIQGKGLLLGLVCDRPAVEVRNALLEQDILTGTSADPHVLRILAPLVISDEHVDHLARALTAIPGGNT
ncbi:MAG: aminotransferase class III-fold pyridoxal phosphate-dependent enzyme, partial [Gammaproteobacteria bacterium]|nr:aminotransferase class III-fold pyridoxal phosphate-dependent enzyme [Gammaproteobacteria bacterium]